MSWEKEKSRHVDFQCVRSKSITNLLEQNARYDNHSNEYSNTSYGEVNAFQVNNSLESQIESVNVRIPNFQHVSSFISMANSTLSSAFSPTTNLNNNQDQNVTAGMENLNITGTNSNGEKSRKQ